MNDVAQRVFAGVDLSPEVRMALAGELSGLAIPGRVVPPQNWHLTLRFLGHVDWVTYERYLAELDTAADNRAFRLRLEGLGGFPRPGRASVVWVGVGGDSEALGALAAVAEEAAVAVGLQPEERPFRPHLTLARVRPPEDVERLVADAPPFSLGWDVEELVLFRSHLGGGGARYQRLDAIELR